MSGNNENLKTWILVKEGPTVKNHKIEGMALAQLLIDIQRAYDNIGQSKYGKDYKKEDCRLYIDRILPGSVACPAGPLTLAPRLFDDEISPYLEVTGTFERLINTLSLTPDCFQSQLEEEVTDPLARIGVLKSLRSLSGSASPVHIKTAAAQPQEGSSIPKHCREQLNDLLFEYGASGEMTRQGIIVGFHGEKGQHFFTIKTKSGSNIRCYFDPKDEDTIQSLIHKWVSVTGNVVRTQKSYKFESVSTVIEQKTEELTIIGEYPLLEPIEFQTSYNKEDNLWGMVNEEMALYGYGENYHKTISSLVEEIEGHVLSFTTYPDEKHTKESLVIKKKLQEHLDFTSALTHIKEKYEAE